MTKLKTLKDALLDGLKDLYSAENQLLKALPKMEKKASSTQLKEAFRSHLKETEGQIGRLEEIAALLEEKLSGKTCKAMQGLIEEGKEVLEEESENTALVDALLIGAAQRVEHYEMAGYGSVIAMAEALEEEEIAGILQATYDEELAADEKLSDISVEDVLPAALEAQEGADERHGEKPSKQPKPRRSTAAKAAVIVALGAYFASGAVVAADPNRNESEAVRHEADNTGRNARDADGRRLTADDQDLAGGDTKLLASIRRAVVESDKLSTYAKNVKIIVQDGTVTLRGPVRTAEEKSWIGATASKLAPKYKLVNELEVSPS